MNCCKKCVTESGELSRRFDKIIEVMGTWSVMKFILYTSADLSYFFLKRSFPFVLHSILENTVLIIPYSLLGGQALQFIMN